jgi:hypothetical protein
MVIFTEQIFPSLNPSINTNENRIDLSILHHCCLLPSAHYTDFAGYANANISVYPPPQWHPDTAATTNIMLDIGNLCLADDYKGSEILNISNGCGLNIPHNGSPTLSSQHKQFKLKDILHVTYIAKQLISVKKFVSLYIVSYM